MATAEDKRPVGRPPAPYPRVNATFEEVIKASGQACKAAFRLTAP